MRKAAALVAVAAALVLGQRPAHAQSIVTCESMNGSRHFCAVDARGGVSLRQQVSGNACVEGQTWGYTRGGIWVSGGCRAQFNVGTTAAAGYGSGRYNNGGYNNTYNNNGNNNNVPTGAEAMCRRAVRSQIGRMSISTWTANNSRNNPRIGWRASNGDAGSCRVDRNGNVTVRFDHRV